MNTSMIRDLFNENKLSPEFKQYAKKVAEKPTLGVKNFLAFLFGTSLNVVLAYANCMKIYTNEASNIIYALFMLQSLVTVILIAATFASCYAVAKYKGEVIAKLKFTENSLFQYAIRKIARVAGLTYIATLVLTNHSLIFASLILYNILTWFCLKLSKEMLTNAANELTQEELDEIYEEKQKEKLTTALLGE